MRAVRVRCQAFTPPRASDILLNVFLAIAVDNLADADSLNTDPADKKWVSSSSLNVGVPELLRAIQVCIKHQQSIMIF